MTEPRAKPKPKPESKPKSPCSWGQNQADYLAALENQWVRIGFIDGKTLKGVLTGADTYELFVRLSNGSEVLVAKGAIKYLHASAAGGQDE